MKQRLAIADRADGTELRTLEDAYGEVFKNRRWPVPILIYISSRLCLSSILLPPLAPKSYQKNVEIMHFIACLPLPFLVPRVGNSSPVTRLEALMPSVFPKPKTWLIDVQSDETFFWRGLQSGSRLSNCRFSPHEQVVAKTSKKSIPHSYKCYYCFAAHTWRLALFCKNTFLFERMCGRDDSSSSQQVSVANESPSICTNWLICLCEGRRRLNHNKRETRWSTSHSSSHTKTLSSSRMIFSQTRQRWHKRAHLQSVGRLGKRATVGNF